MHYEVAVSRVEVAVIDGLNRRIVAIGVSAECVHMRERPLTFVATSLPCNCNGKFVIQEHHSAGWLQYAVSSTVNTW